MQEQTLELDSDRVRQATMLFMSTNRWHRRVFEKLVSELKISNSQHRMLMHLYRTDCTQSQTELARQFEVSTAAIAVVLKKLEKRGYIRRCAAINDSRYNEIALTEEGLSLVRETNRLFTTADMSMFSGFSEEELENLIGYLDRMRGTLKSIGSGEMELPEVQGIHLREIIAGVEKDDGQQ